MPTVLVVPDMSRTSFVPWNSLERWTAVAFVLGALAALGSSALYQVEVAGILTTPVWVNGILTNLTYGAASAGLLGLYPRLKDRAAWLTRIGLVAVVIVLASVIAANIGRLLFGAGGPGIIKLAVSISFYSSTTLAFLLYGVASVRTSAYSRRLGIPLLVVASSRLVIVAGGVLGQTWLLDVGAVLFALPLLAVGYLLWTRSIPVAAPQASPASRT